jgi:hypothetical protein
MRAYLPPPIGKAKNICSFILPQEALFATQAYILMLLDFLLHKLSLD